MIDQFMRRRLSDACEASRRLSDTYEPSRRLSDAYEHNLKKKLSLWFLVQLKEKIHAPSEVTVGFWFEM